RDALPEIQGQGLFERLDAVLATGEPYLGCDLPVWVQRAPEAPLEARVLDFVYQPLDAPNAPGILVHGVDVTERAAAHRDAALV
ncbi:hypothetical protein NL490_27695, partial [Klebsiella pneumoniae]|nr:hypothetical protein [Klebsiella pneumoniae]